jgi:integrase
MMTMSFNELVDQYIKSKKLAWARTSQKNERARLNKHGSHVLDNPFEYYEVLKKRMKAYSIKSTFVRLGKFYEFLMDIEAIPMAKNPWKAFLTDNAMTFKYSYQPERLKVKFKEAQAKINSMPEYQYRMASRQMLEAGLRYCELRTFDGVKVIGKGSKPRTVFMSHELKSFRYTGSYTPLYKSLVAVGLKPHSLRKLCATEFSRNPNVKDQDTCKFFGWSSIETSIKYRQPHDDSRMDDLIQSVVSGTKKPKIDIKGMLRNLLSKIEA